MIDIISEISVHWLRIILCTPLIFLVLVLLINQQVLYIQWKYGLRYIEDELKVGLLSHVFTTDVLMSPFCTTDALSHCDQLILDFLDEIVQNPTVLIGNSIGSLACVIAASGIVSVPYVSHCRTLRLCISNVKKFLSSRGDI